MRLKRLSYFYIYAADAFQMVNIILHDHFISFVDIILSRGGKGYLKSIPNINIEQLIFFALPCLVEP